MATSNTDIQIRIDTALNSAQAATSLREMRTSMRELQGLALEVGNSNTEAFNRITTAIGESRDRMNDLNDSIQTTSGDPLEKVGKSVGLISSSLSSLDFGGATIGIKSLRENLSNLNFGELSSGLKSFGAEFMKLGAVILTNPIFLLGAAILLIITNFEKLKNAGGLIGDMFTGLSNALQSFIGLITKLTDSLGLTNSKLEEQKQLTLDLIESTKDYNAVLLDYEKTVAEIEDKSTILIEYKQKLNEVDALYAAFNAKYGSYASTKDLKDFLGKFESARKAILELNKQVGQTLFISSEEKQSIIKDILEYYRALGQFNNIYLVNAAKINKEIESENRKFATERINRMYDEKEKELALLENSYKEKTRLDNLEHNRQMGQLEDQEKILDTQAEMEQRYSNIKASQVRDEIDSLNKLIEVDEKSLNKKKEKLKLDIKIWKETYDLDPIKSRRKQLAADVAYEVRTMEKDIEINKNKIKSLEKNETELKEKSSYWENYKLNTKKKYDEYKLNYEAEFADREKEQTKRYEQDKLDIINKYLLKRKDAEISHMIKMEQLRSAEINKSTLANLMDSTYNFNKKQREKEAGEQLEALKKQREKIKESYDIQISLAHNNADEQKRLRGLQLESNKEYWQKMLILIKNFYEDEKRYSEKAASDREKVLKDDIELKKKSIDAYITTFNSRKAINEMDQAMMKQGEERYSFNLGERLRLLKENLRNENEVLNGEERKALLDNMLNNTTNAEQRDLEIRQEYAAKRAKLEKDSQASRIAAATEEADKIYSATKKGLEMWSAINTYYDTVDENRQDQSEEQAEQRAKAKFERNKELQLANAIVNTAAATIFPLIEGDYAGAIFAAALGAVQIATIMATQYKSTGTTTTNPVIAPEAAKPTSAAGGFMGQGFTNQQFNPNDFMNNQYKFQNGNQKVYVLESDITNMVNRVAVAQDRNTLRGW